MRSAPCNGCLRRTITCHGVCREYQDWKKAREPEAAAREAEKDCIRTTRRLCGKDRKKLRQRGR